MGPFQKIEHNANVLVNISTGCFDEMEWAPPDLGALTVET